MVSNLSRRPRLNGGKARLLDVRSDVVFKKIFGQHPNLIKSFLNNILPLAENSLIETIEYLPFEQTPRIPELKNTIVDVKCKDSNGRIFIVEMQLNWTDSFFKRFLFGASTAYVQQLQPGDGYSKLSPVYGLAILNTSFDKSSEEWFHHYRLTNKNNVEKTLDGLELIFLELEKFKAQNSDHKKIGILWLRFLKEINESLDDVPREFTEIQELAEAVELAKESTYTIEELRQYDAFLDAVRVEKTIREDSKAEGEKIGLEKGKAEGEKIGLDKGKEEKLIELAKKMLGKGMAITEVSDITDLRIAELEKLRAELAYRRF